VIRRRLRTGTDRRAGHRRQPQRLGRGGARAEL